MTIRAIPIYFSFFVFLVSLRLSDCLPTLAPFYLSIQRQSFFYSKLHLLQIQSKFIHLIFFIFKNNIVRSLPFSPLRHRAQWFIT